MANPWLKFYTSDWRSDPRLKMCSAGARGVWIEMICLMHEATPYGHLLIHGQTPNEAQLASLTGIPLAELEQYLPELEQMGVFSRTKEGVIYSRKLVRMASRSAKMRKNGKQGGNPKLLNEQENSDLLKPQDKPPDKPQSPEARNQSMIGGGGSARAREAPPPDRTERENLLVAMGADPISGLIGPTGKRIGGAADMLEVGRWRDDLGLTDGEIRKIVGEVMAKKRDGPPSTFTYFSNAMQRYAGQKQAPALKPTDGGENDKTDTGHSNIRATRNQDRVQAFIAGARGAS